MLKLHKFDAEVTKVLDNAYQGADLTRQRQASFDALQPRPGDSILSIGCANCLFAVEVARAAAPGPYHRDRPERGYTHSWQPL